MNDGGGPERPFELPARRFEVTAEWMAMLGASLQKLRFTYGFDAAGKVRECFCGCFKVGSNAAHHAVAICIDLSHALQYGVSVEQLASAYSMTETHPLHALVREIVQQGLAIENEYASEARALAMRSGRKL